MSGGPERGPMPDCERRAQPRETAARPCKLYVPRVGRYLPGSTSNLSSGGVLLRLEQSAGVAPGDSVFLGIAMKRHHVILVANEMIEARIVRVMETPEDGVVLAARFVRTAATRVAA